ncbi:MAG: ATP-binding protein, partial [Polaromonas sp.]|nr:ATP-binding protein [Polaromonas sp.]
VLNGHCEREPQRQVAITVTHGLWVTGDHRLLQQVMDNLLGNAWKFSSQAAQASIHFSCSTGSTGEPVFTVQDNGAGFDMAYADKLFGAFQRLHTSAEFAGTGIGLATVHRIITRHGGRIWAESVPGEGASFHFTIGKPQD